MKVLAIVKNDEKARRICEKNQEFNFDDFQTTFFILHSSKCVQIKITKWHTQVDDSLRTNEHQQHDFADLDIAFIPWKIIGSEFDSSAGVDHCVETQGIIEKHYEVRHNIKHVDYHLLSF
jgi:hypothetical protein